MERKKRLCLFALCCGVMAAALFGRRLPDWDGDYWQLLHQNRNLIPLDTLKRYVRLLNGNYSLALRRHAAANLAGNLVLFVPLGYFPPLLWRSFRPLWRCLLKSTLMITAIELLQLVTLLGSCDVDDLLLNLLGVTLGYALSKLQEPEPR